MTWSHHQIEMHQDMGKTVFIEDITPRGKAKFLIEWSCLGLSMKFHVADTEIRQHSESLCHHSSADLPATIKFRDNHALDLGEIFIDEAKTQRADGAIIDAGEQVMTAIIEAIKFSLPVDTLLIDEDNLSKPERLGEIVGVRDALNDQLFHGSHADFLIEKCSYRAIRSEDSLDGEYKGFFRISFQDVK